MKKILFLFISVLLLASCSDNEVSTDSEFYYGLKAITLNKTEIKNMITGDTRQLRASFKPAEATDKTVEWISDNSSVAEVDENGKVTATGKGNATITVTTPDGAIQASCTIEVTQTSGITIHDAISDDILNENDPLIFLIGSDAREFYCFVSVHNSLNKNVTIKSGNEEILSVDYESVNGETHFSLLPTDDKSKQGETTVTITSVANLEMKFVLPVKVLDANVTEVKLGFDKEGQDATDALSGSVTINTSVNVNVFFATTIPGITTPTNPKVFCNSSNPQVATVPATGSISYDGKVTVPVTLIDNPDNAINDAQSVITITSEDGNHSATFTVTAKMPRVERIELNTTLSRPIVAGDTCHLSVKVYPEDAYIKTVTWSSENESIATVDANGIVTIKPDFGFDPENYTASEIKITATSNDNASLSESCTLRPFQYTEVQGVIVKDQWGNRMKGALSGGSKLTTAGDFAIQYCSGSGGKTIGEISPWGTPNPPVAGVEQLGCIRVTFTATPWPNTYPNITDPTQEFFWTSSSDNKMCIPRDDDPEGTLSVGSYKNSSGDDAKDIIKKKGQTCTFFTASKSTSDASVIRIYKVDPSDIGDGKASKAILFKFGVHTNKGEEGKNGNTNIGTCVYKLNTNAFANPFDDPVPWN